MRKPFDYFTFNAWLPELPGYVLSGHIPLQQKLEFLPGLVLFWFSADSPYGGVDWGFAVSVSDLLRSLVLSLLFGLYFALVFYCRDQNTFANWSLKRNREGGVVGALGGVLGVTTGGCSVMGCGAPVIPVFGLASFGLSSGTLAALATVSRVAIGFIFVAVTLGVIVLGWLARGGEGPGRQTEASNNAATKILPGKFKP